MQSAHRRRRRFSERGRRMQAPFARKGKPASRSTRYGAEAAVAVGPRNPRGGFDDRRDSHAHRCHSIAFVGAFELVHLSCRSASIVSPVRCNTFLVAGIGPVSMIRARSRRSQVHDASAWLQAEALHAATSVGSGWAAHPPLSRQSAIQARCRATMVLPGGARTHGSGGDMIPTADWRCSAPT